MRIALSTSLAVLLLAGAFLMAQPPSDLDQLMERVLARRDENWKKLQQYLLEEKETFDLAGPGANAFLRHLTANDVDRLTEPGRAQYGADVKLQGLLYGVLIKL